MISNKLIQAAAGNAAGDPVFVDDLFNALLYTGTGSSVARVNGIDLDDKGGLVWSKRRNGTHRHGMYDSERGIRKRISSDSTLAEASDNNGLTSFNSNGFTSGSADDIGGNNDDYVAWTFAKQEKFFDIVTYSGNGAGSQTISHNLGSPPGFLVVRPRNAGATWRAFHRSMGNDATGTFNENYAFSPSDNIEAWAQTDFTDTTFTVGTTNNTSGYTFVAYLFAHNNNDGGFGAGLDEDIIKCDTYTGNGSTNGTEVNLGFEPQLLMIKNVADESGTDWHVVDSTRGVDLADYVSSLKWNEPTAEIQNVPWVRFTPTGFKLTKAEADYNASNVKYIYMAIARPHKPIESATEGFKTVLYDGNATTNDGVDLLFNIQSRTLATGLPFDIDMTIAQWRSGTQPSQTNSLMARGMSRAYQIRTHSTRSMQQEDNTLVRFSTRISKALALHAGGTTFLNLSGRKYVTWNWKRAPKFFDTVTYKGTGSLRTVAHNLKVAPEMIWYKILKPGEGLSNENDDWNVHVPAIGNNKYLVLNSNGVANTDGSNVRFNNTAPSATQLTVNTTGTVNRNNHFYIAMLFATLPGISKVGTYTGNAAATNSGSNQNIDCGFSNGARFVLIKGTTVNSAWAVFDTQRGIIDAEDPILQLHTQSVEYDGNNGGADYIDPHSSGFTVLATGGGTINQQGETYLFYAIAT